MYHSTSSVKTSETTHLLVLAMQDLTLAKTPFTYLINLENLDDFKLQNSH